MTMPTEDTYCRATTLSGARCRARRLRGGQYCFAHDPDNRDEADEARRRGGFNRKHEKHLQTEYRIEALDTVRAIRRLLEIATFEALTLETSIAKSRMLVSVAMVAARLLELGELEDRIEVVGRLLPGAGAEKTAS